MAVILKYKVEPKPEVQEIEIASGGRLVSAIEQNGEIMVYAMVDNDQYYESLPKSKRSIFVVGTGCTFDMTDLYVTNFIGTVKVGSLVFHIFEVYDQPF